MMVEYRVRCRMEWEEKSKLVVPLSSQNDITHAWFLLSREVSPTAADARKSATAVPSSQSPPRPPPEVGDEAQADEAQVNGDDEAPNPNANTKAKKTTRKATKSKSTVKDKVIELGSGDLQKNRHAYSDEMKKLNDVKRVEKDALAQVKMAKMFVFQVPVGIHAPELRDCEW